MARNPTNENVLSFAGFDLNLDGPELRLEGRVVALRPKSLALIIHLAQRPGQLVRKEDLVDAVWGTTAVTDGTLARTLFDARNALGDDSREPRFIETVHRLGFRFLAQARAPVACAPPRVTATDSPLVGRHGELRCLREWRDLAESGIRQFVFVAGEPGIGKTAILEAFLADCAPAVMQRYDSDSPPYRAPAGTDGSLTTLVARGQCIEHYGAAEAYLPLLDAMGDLCRSCAADAVVPVMRRVAPTWLAQMPWLIDDADRAELERELRGVTSDRMLRELAQALETIAQQRLVILALEDLHWSDTATADLLAFLARRASPARLMVLASYRPVDAVLTDNPIPRVHHELRRQNRCHALSIEPLSTVDVSELVARRFDSAAFVAELAVVVHRRTEGNPLFIVSVLDDLVSQGRIAEVASEGWQLGGRMVDIEHSVPDGLAQMVRAQVDRLETEELAVVEAASIVGASFSSAAVAAALQRDLMEVEELCEAMARRGVLLDRIGAAAWPDGTSAGSYSFRHALYCDALYKGIPAAKRRLLHARVGDRLERGYAGDLAVATAGALGRHFEEAGDHPRAARHLRQAAQVAARRGAAREALALIARTRVHLEQLPGNTERTVEELVVEMAAGPAQAAIEGYASPEVERIFTRARDLCRTLGDGPQLFPVLWGLWSFWCVRGRIREALEMANQLFDLAQRSGDPEMILEGHHALWVTLYFRGDIGECDRHLDAGLALYDRSHHFTYVMKYGQDPAVVALAYRGLVRQAQGREREATAEAAAAVELGRRLGHPVSLLFGVAFMARMHMNRRDAGQCRALAEELLEIASSNGLAFWQANGAWAVSRALAATDPAAGVAGMRAAIEALHAMGARMGLPGHLSTMADVVLRMGDIDEARRLLDEADTVAKEAGERLGSADVLRLRGDLECRVGTGAISDVSAKRAEAFYREALVLARLQGATGLELKTALDLARLWRAQSRAGETAALLAPILGRLPPDEDYPEIVEARAHLHA